MIVDTSALLAILFDEPDAESYARALAEADTARLSAGSFVEAAIVVEAQTNASYTDDPRRYAAVRAPRRTSVVHTPW
jgi:uncharacterized protein with PIN domain